MALHCLVQLFVISLFPILATSSDLFDSRDAHVRTVIAACYAKFPSHSYDYCYKMLSCILDGIESWRNTSWSAGASILAFIPTIVGLMSNSIHEISAVTEQSTVMAVLLCTSSITAFSSRFGEGDSSASLLGREKQDYHEQLALEDMARAIRENSSNHRHLARTSARFQYIAAVLMLLALTAGVWYQLYETARYGRVVFACDIRVNVWIWAGLTQLLSLLNVAWRSKLSDIRRVRVGPGKKDSTPRSRIQRTIDMIHRYLSPRETTSQHPLLLSALKESQSEAITIVLRSPRSTTTKWTLQTLTAVFSYVLYTYGTVILASTTMIPASDATRAMATIGSGAGFGRLVGYWMISPERRGKGVLILDVPSVNLDGLVDAILKL